MTEQQQQSIADVRLIQELRDALNQLAEAVVEHDNDTDQGLSWNDLSMANARQVIDKADRRLKS
jgi:hypothetical protein